MTMEFTRQETDYPHLVAVVVGLRQYFMPCLIAFGLLGNGLSLLVFLFTPLSRLSLSVYLAALAASDCGFLVSLFFGWKAYFGRALFHSSGFCQLVVYLSYTCSFLSVWFVVAFTVERYIAICHPLQRPEMCTTARAKKVVIGLSVFAMVLYSCNFWSTGLVFDPTTNLTTCMPLREYYSVQFVLTYGDAIITLFVPFMAIVIFNIIIAHRIAYFYHKRQSLMSIAHYGAQNARQCRAQIKVTKMLLYVSTVLLVTNLPSYVIRFRAFIITFTRQPMGAGELDSLVQRLFQFLYYVNFSVNFLLYNVSSRKFRVNARRLLWQMKTRVGSVFSRMSSVRKTQGSPQNTIRLAEVGEGPGRGEAQGCRAAVPSEIHQHVRPSSSSSSISRRSKGCQGAVRATPV